jgi:putative oxidoreductase
VSLGLLVLRIVVGVVFVAHGSQKLFAAFGGPGIERFAAALEHMGMPPGRPHAYASGAAELAGGFLLALGLLTPVATALITAVMVVAVVKVHLRGGFFVTNEGYEFNLVLVAAAFALAGVGAGAWSLDHAFGLDVAGTGWALGALAAGLLGGAGALVSGRLVHRRAHPPGGAQPGAA